MEQQSEFLPLLVVVLLAFSVPLALSRSRWIPVVVGEILAGVLIGPSWLGLVHGDEFTLELLSEIGFAFLMFLSGLEIDFSLLFNPSPGGKKQRLPPLGIAGLSFLLTLTLALGIGWGLHQADLIGDMWIMALILSTTSLGVVVPVLKERELITGRFGQTLLLAALIADFFTMFLITVYVAIRSSGLTLDILLIGVLFLAFLVTYRFGFRQLQRPTVRRVIEELSGATAQIKVRGAIALMIAFVVLAEYLSVELILGAFLAGAVASLLSRPEDESLRHKLDAMGFGFFIPLFFIVVGVRFDLQAFLNDPRAWLLAPLLVGAALAIKMLSALIFKAGFTWRETVASGVMLSARLSLIIAASAIGMRLGAINQATNAAIILVAALTSMFSPMIFNWVIPPTKKRKARQVLIYGATNLGLQVAQELTAHGEQVRFLNPDTKPAELIQREGFPVVQGEGTVETFEHAGFSQCDTVLVLSSDDQRNYQVCKSALSLGGGHVVALVHDPSRLDDFRGLGVQAFTPGMHRATMLALIARNPDIVALLTSTTDGRNVREIYLRNAKLEHISVEDLVLPGDSLILAIGREEEVMIPHASLRLELGDRLTVLGELSALQDVQRLLSG